MSEVIGVDAVEAMLGRWSPSDLAYVEGLRLYLKESTSALEISALFQRRVREKGWPSPDGMVYPVSLAFSGVRNLSLEDFGGGRVQIMGFDISSVADRGWENVNFEVSDYEDGKLFFYCVSVRVLKVGAARTLANAHIGRP